MSTPTVSFQTVSGTFDGRRDENRDRILAPELVEFLADDQPGASVLNFAFTVDGDMPPAGVEVVLNVDSNFADYFTSLGREPFGGGGEVLGAVYAEDGVTPTGIRFLLTSPNALFSLTAAQTDEAETDGPETLDFSLAEGDGYTINADAQASTVTFYDTLADVPDLGDGPQVGLTIDQTALVETEGTELTLTFDVQGDIPDGGVLVYVDSGTRAAVGEFNVFDAEVSGGVLPSPNFIASGFYFNVLEDNASLKLTVLDETTNPQIDPADAVEGIESFTFSLVEGPGYTIDPDAPSVSYTIADDVDAVPLVSLSTAPEVLIESEGTVAIVTLEASTLPAEGLVVTLDAAEMIEFDPQTLTIEGAEPISATPDNTSFTIRMLEPTATVSITIADDGEAEGIETATFSLAASDDYLIAPAADSGTFTISDAPIAPPPTDSESNDTIATAIATGLTADNQLVTINGELAQQRSPAVDRTEDVDMYSVELAAGDVLRLDIDARAIFDSSESPDSILRVFTADGTQVAQSDDDFAPDELFGPGRQDSYVEFTAETAGTYYVGVSSFGNGEFGFTNAPYDPNVAGSGTGRSFGQYILNMSLNQESAAAETEIPDSTGEGPTVSLAATPGTYDSDDNLTANALVQFTPDGSASILTLGLNVDGAIPEEGVEVYLTSNIDLSTIFSTSAPFSPGSAEVLGAVFNEAGEPIGLRINLSSSSDIINLNLADPDEAPTDGEETVTFTLEPAAGYVVGADSFSTTVYDTLADVPALPTVPTVGIAVSETALVESEGNTATLTFTLDTPPPAEGVIINVDSGIRAALGEFDVFNAEIVGGNFPSPNFQASGFFFQMTEQTATITLAAFDETTNPDIPAEAALEGIEEFTFTVQPGVGYAIAPEASAVTVTIADTPDSVVLPPDDGTGGGGGGDTATIPFEEEFNDTIADAIDTELSTDNLSFIMQAEIDAIRATRNLIDATEDVDMYAFDLQAGDTIAIDIDSIPYELDEFDRPQAVDTELRIFNEAGEELLLNTEAPAPGELFESGRDAYVEFTATESGTYYAGVALLSNRAYDPNVQGSGSGRVFPSFGINTGEYTIEATLTVGDAGTDDLLEGTDDNDILEGFRGNDIISGGGGNDISFGGEGSDRVRGDAGNDVVSGDSGNDLVVGGPGDDILMGVTGRDVLVGDMFFPSDGSDIFVYGNGDGTDTIIDFTPGVDQIGLVEGELTFEDITLTQDGTSTLLGVAASGEVLAVLNGVQVSDLTADSFTIVPDVSDPSEAIAFV
ncbi:MAG: pre-peptidase C-terminal domain-containing protein [Cyanobacteria bacterium P01_C01_bin.70]